MSGQPKPDYRALVLDLDGVLANFNASYANLLKAAYPAFDMKKAENPKTWFWDKAAGVPNRIITQTWETIQEGPGFWQRLTPLVNKEVFEDINHFALVLPTYVITSRPHGYGYSIVDVTSEWLCKHCLSNVGVIACQTKGSLVEPLGIRFFLDDRVENVNEVAKVVFDKCSDIPVVAMLNASYNEDAEIEDGVIRVDSVTEFLDIVFNVVRSPVEEDKNDSTEADEGTDSA